MFAQHYFRTQRCHPLRMSDADWYEGDPPRQQAFHASSASARLPLQWGERADKGSQQLQNGRALRPWLGYRHRLQPPKSNFCKMQAVSGAEEDVRLTTTAEINHRCVEHLFLPEPSA